MDYKVDFLNQTNSHEGGFQNPALLSKSVSPALTSWTCSLSAFDHIWSFVELELSQDKFDLDVTRILRKHHFQRTNATISFTLNIRFVLLINISISAVSIIIVFNIKILRCIKRNYFLVTIWIPYYGMLACSSTGGNLVSTASSPVIIGRFQI